MSKFSWLGRTTRPRGTRSFLPIRGLLFSSADYPEPEHANYTVVTFAKIATRKGLENLEVFLSNPG